MLRDWDSMGCKKKVVQVGRFLLKCECEETSDKKLVGQTVTVLCDSFTMFIYDMLIVLTFLPQFFPYLIKNNKLNRYKEWYYTPYI